MKDRPILFRKYKSILYAKTETDYFAKKEELFLDDTCLKYPNFINHLEKLYFNRKHTWAISVRNDEELPTHSTNTSNYFKASLRITKDSQFNQTKAFNLVDLVDIDLIIPIILRNDFLIF